jgi:hypothetical protein
MFTVLRARIVRVGPRAWLPLSRAFHGLEPPATWHGQPRSSMLGGVATRCHSERTQLVVSTGSPTIWQRWSWPVSITLLR